MNRYPHCPPWCGDHSDNGSDLHRSAHDRIPLGVHEHGFVASYAAGEDDKAPSVAVNAVVYHNPRIDVVLWIHNPEKARDLALLIEWLDHATPGQHRVLAAQIRGAAKVVTENDWAVAVDMAIRDLVCLCGHRAAEHSDIESGECTPGILPFRQGAGRTTGTARAPAIPPGGRTYPARAARWSPGPEPPQPGQSADCTAPAIVIVIIVITMAGWTPPEILRLLALLYAGG